MAMRLSEAEAPINLDLRNQILRDIQSGRDTQAAISHKISTIPAGTTNPFEGDQAAYGAAVKGFQQSDPVVVALLQRLTANQGPYWKELTQQERDGLALWTESLKQMDSITSKYYPTSTEMNVKNLILLAIGVGAIFGPLLFTKDTGSGFPFSLLPKPEDLPFDRAPVGLPAPLRTAAPALPYRSAPRAESVRASEEAVSRSSRPSSRFSRGFAESAATPVSASAGGLPYGNVMRPGGERRFVYPKPRTS